jgi:ATP-binding cassette subfamily F protein 3
LTDRLAKIERELDRLAAEKTAIEDWLASPDAYAEGRKEELKARLAQQGDLVWELAGLESEWLEVSAALEALGTA